MLFEFFDHVTRPKGGFAHNFQKFFKIFLTRVS